MPSAYTPILVFAILSAAFPIVAIAIYKRLHPAEPSSEKPVQPSFLEMDIRPTAPLKYAGRFYAIAALVVVLTVALVFLFVWAIRCAEMGGYGLVSILVFVGILLVGYAWLCRQGALDWT